jgi:hypothetical protein
MQDRPTIPSRPWRVIAEELSRETNPKRVLELSQELTRAIDEQSGTLTLLSQDGNSDVPVIKRNPNA